MLRNTSTRPLVVAGLATATLVGAAAAETKPQTVYVIPITGQMGTDIHASIYEDIIKDVKEVRPDIVIFRLKSADVDTNDHIQNDDRRESGFWEQLEGYRDLMLDIKDGLSEAGVEDGDQIMWIEDCVGPATLLAMSWPNIYMTEGARLQGFDAVQRFADGWSDADVRAKMYAAWVGIATGFPQAGGFPLSLSQAMIEPQHSLGVKFNGRKTEWSNDLKGTAWTIDGSDKRVAYFDSDSAENVMLSQGTVSDLDDLVFLLGHREYETVDSGVKLHEQYVEDWRRAYDRCQEWLKDIRDRGGSTIQDLGAQQGYWEKILAALRRYPAVENRFKREMGLDAFGAETEIEKIKEARRQGQKNGRNNNRRGGNTGGGGGLGS
jgi:hypothetical protein